MKHITTKISILFFACAAMSREFLLKPDAFAVDESLFPSKRDYKVLGKEEVDDGQIYFDKKPSNSNSQNSFIKYLKGFIFDHNIHSDQQQQPMMRAEEGGNPNLIRSALTQLGEIYTFTSYVRNIEPIAEKLSKSNKWATVFAPTDEALSKLDKKPWEFPEPVSDEDSPDAEKIIAKNIEHFLSNHISFSDTYSDENHLSTENGFVVTLGDNEKTLVAISTDGKELKANIMKSRKLENGIIYVIDNCLL